MAHTTISPSIATALRNEPHTITDVRLNMVAPESVATLTVTAIPVTSPLVSLTVSGSMTNVLVGQLVKIYSGTTIKTWGVVRKAPSGSTLYITPVMLGDGGFATNIETAIAVNDDITVYSFHAPFALYSTIIQKTFYKQWDLAYTDQTNYPPPITDLGVWQEGVVNSTNPSVTFTLPKGGVNNSVPVTSNATISSYLWALPSGVTLASGYALTDDVIEVEATEGQHIVSLTVTDSEGKSSTGYVWLFVHDETGVGYQSFGNEYVWQITSDTSSRDGREITFKVFGSDLQSVILPRAGVLFTEYAYAGSTALTDDVIESTFVGYVGDEIEFNAIQTNYGSATFTAKSPSLIASSLVLPPQIITLKNPATNWTQANSYMMQPRGAVYYALKWHSPTLLNWHGVDLPYLLPYKFSYEYNVGNIGEALKVGSNAIAGNIGCDSMGRMVMRKDSMLQNNTYRNALDTVYTWTEEDIKAPLSIKRRIMPAAKELRGGAFAGDGSVPKAWYAIRKWGQGVGSETMPDFTVTTSEGVAKVKEVVGHKYAKVNARIQEIAFEVVGNLDIAEPVYLDAWHKFDFDADNDPNGEGFSNARMLPLRVDRSWDISDNAIIKKVTITFEMETFGQPAEEVIIGSATSNLSNNGYLVNQPIPYQQTLSQDSDTVPNIMLIGSDNGKSAISWSIQSSTPQWTSLASFFTSGDSVCDACFDYSSAFFTSGYDITQELSVYVVTTNGTTLTIYRIFDIKASTLSVDTLKTYTMSDSTVTNTARIQCSKGTPTRASVAWHNQSGTKVAFTTDGGATWGTTTTVGSTTTNGNTDNAYLALAMENNYTVVSAHNASLEFNLYVDNNGGGFTLMPNNPFPYNLPHPMAHIRDGTLYVASNDATIGDNYLDPSLDTASDFERFYVQNSSSSSPTFTAGYSPTGGNGGGDSLQIYPDIDIDMPSAGEPQIGMSFIFPNSVLGAKGINQLSFDVWVGGTLVNYSAGGSTLAVYLQDANGVTYDPDGTPNGSNLFFDTYASPTLNSWIAYASPYDASPPNLANHDYLIWVYFIPSVSSNDTWVSPLIKLDNIQITYQDSTGVQGELYKITSYTGGSPVWTDITPLATYVPRTPYMFTTDTANATNLACYSVQGNNLVSGLTGTDMSISDDEGATWSTIGTGGFAVKNSNDVLITDMDIQFWNGTTFADAVNVGGNIDTAWDNDYNQFIWIVALL